jgi:hypothetical protein
MASLARKTGDTQNYDDASNEVPTSPAKQQVCKKPDNLTATGASF